jgi:hypothetical protein
MDLLSNTSSSAASVEAAVNRCAQSQPAPAMHPHAVFNTFQFPCACAAVLATHVPANRC